MDNEALINELIKLGYVKTPRIIEAFRAIDRKDFVPPERADEAYGNYPLPIGHGQTISQPLTVAFMLELLDPQPGEQILDIGAGSGWQTALLAHCVSQESGKNGKRGMENDLVIAIERIPELAEMAERNIAKYDFSKRGIVQVLCADGSRGAPADLAPKGSFDKIIAAAAAGHDIPEVWKTQLKAGGRIVAPVGNSVFRFTKKSNTELVAEEYPGFAFVPLVKGGDQNN